MVNLAEQDTSFLVPCRHCGDLLPEQDRICPHCGKDQSVAPVKGAVPSGSPGLPSDDATPDPFPAARGADDFMAAGPGAHLADDGSARRRRKAIGIVALIAGVLLLGMAYDRYEKQRATAPSPPTLAQEAPTTAIRPATAAGPVVRGPATATPSTTPDAPAATTSGTTPSATSPVAPATATTADPASPCNEALAAMSLCARP